MLVLSLALARLYATDFTSSAASPGYRMESVGTLGSSLVNAHPHVLPSLRRSRYLLAMAMRIASRKSSLQTKTKAPLTLQRQVIPSSPSPLILQWSSSFFFAEISTGWQCWSLGPFQAELRSPTSPTYGFSS